MNDELVKRRLIWAALMMGQAVFVLVAFIREPPPPPSGSALLMVAPILALTAAFASIVLPGFLRRGAEDRDADEGATDAKLAQQAMVLLIAGVAPAEVVTILGLGLVITGHSMLVAAPFYVVGAGLIAVHFPRGAQL